MYQRLKGLGASSSGDLESQMYAARIRLYSFTGSGFSADAAIPVANLFASFFTQCMFHEHDDNDFSNRKIQSIQFLSNYSTEPQPKYRKHQWWGHHRFFCAAILEWIRSQPIESTLKFDQLHRVTRKSRWNIAQNHYHCQSVKPIVYYYYYFIYDNIYNI